MELVRLPIGPLPLARTGSHRRPANHGSGPRYTALLDPGFSIKLARYAQLFAERYPQVYLYTPVNEPLTTARFSALYGHWFPHAREASLFLRALFNQCKAIVLAMREVRKARPDALLVETEDLGRISGLDSLFLDLNSAGKDVRK